MQAMTTIATRTSLRPQRSGSRHPRQAARRGIASLMAMLYLLIFSTLALGFYSAVTTAAQLAANDEKALGAQAAVESGLAFIRYELSRVRVPGKTPPNQMLEEVLKDLVEQQAATPNINGKGIAIVDNVLHLPAGVNDFVALDNQGAGFRAEMRMSEDGSDWIKVKVHGRYRGTTIARAVEIYFQPVVSSTKVFDYGIVTRGRIIVSGGGVIGGGSDATHGSVLSMSQHTNPISLSGTSGIAGDAYMTNKNGTVSISGSGVSIGGETDPVRRATHIHAGVEAPDLPDADSSPFLPFVQTVYVPGKSEYRNVLIPANTNPTFSSAVTLKGVTYIEHPNKVTFNGQVTIHGSVVVQNGAVPSNKNLINISAGVQAYGIDTLDPDDPDFPPELRALKGSTLIAPGHHVELGGSSGSIGGVMLGYSFKMVGSSGGVINGTFIGLGDVPMEFTGGSSIARTKPDGPIPAGLVFPKKFTPVQRTYSEVAAPSGTPVASSESDEGQDFGRGGQFAGQGQQRGRELKSIHHLVVVVPGRGFAAGAREGGRVSAFKEDDAAALTF